MTIITKMHIERALGPKGAKKAKKRRTGGDANDRGHEFEKAFTINSILGEVEKYLDGKGTRQAVRFQSQPLGFVDDLVVCRESLYSDYFELKSGATQRCTLALKYNIARQQKVLVDNHICGRINLVLQKHLAEDVNVIQRAAGVPVSIVGFEEDIRKDYARIINVVPDLADNYMLITLRVLLEGAWYSLQRNAAIDEIIAEWRFLTNGAVFSPSPIGVSSELEKFFASVGLELRNERDVLRFKINGIGGLFLFQVGSPRWDKFEEYLLLARPDDPMDVHAAIERFNYA